MSESARAATGAAWRGARGDSLAVAFRQFAAWYSPRLERGATESVQRRIDRLAALTESVHGLLSSHATARTYPDDKSRRACVELRAWARLFFADARLTRDIAGVPHDLTQTSQYSQLHAIAAAFYDVIDTLNWSLGAEVSSPLLVAVAIRSMKKFETNARVPDVYLDMMTEPSKAVLLRWLETRREKTA